MIQLGDIRIDRERFSEDEIERNDFWCPDAETARKWETRIRAIRKSGDSVGAMVEVAAKGVPPGLGAPLYGKLDADVASAIMSINAVKSVEIGAGIAAASLKGSENADEIYPVGSELSFGSNNSGGVLGGISTGQDVIARFAVKPASSILIPRNTVAIDGTPTTVVTKGRHDPCVGIRAVPVAEAMLACVLLDHVLLHRGQAGLVGKSAFGQWNERVSGIGGLTNT